MDISIRVVVSTRIIAMRTHTDSRIHLIVIYYPRVAKFELEMIYALLRLQELLRLFIDLNAVFLQLSPGTLLSLLASVGVWEDWVCQYDSGTTTVSTHCVKWPYDRR